MTVRILLLTRHCRGLVEKSKATLILNHRKNQLDTGRKSDFDNGCTCRHWVSEV